MSEKLDPSRDFEGRFVKSSRELFECPDLDCKTKNNLAITCPACFQSGRLAILHSIDEARNHFENFYSDEADHRVVNPFREISIAELNNILTLTVRKDETSKLIIFFDMLLAQTQDSQFNIMQSARSSTGKSYIPLEVSSYFPPSEVLIYSAASPTAFFHENGEQVIEEEDRFVALSEKVEALLQRLEKEGLKTEEKRKIKQEIAKLRAKAKILVDLEGKILIFVDQPHVKLLEKMRPLFSHDQKYIETPITDTMGHGGKRTKHVVLVGFPSVIFCTTFATVDEQESTRNFILSPDTGQDKIQDALALLDMKLSNKQKYHRVVDENIARIGLQFRIELIRASRISRFEIQQGLVLDKFRSSHNSFNPRAMRDFGRLYALVYGHALLNLFQRVKSDALTLRATSDDVNAAFNLYEPICEANESGISPELWNFYKEILCPAFVAKNQGREAESGVTYAELAVHFRRMKKQTIDRKKLKDYIDALICAGLVEESKHPDDARKSVFIPLQSELETKLAHNEPLYILKGKEDVKSQNNI